MPGAVPSNGGKCEAILPARTDRKGFGEFGLVVSQCQRMLAQLGLWRLRSQGFLVRFLAHAASYDVSGSSIQHLRACLKLLMKTRSTWRNDPAQASSSTLTSTRQLAHLQVSDGLVT
mmetsp:Transcript_97124/g.243516  ORF Transcript_97124/g.243516 Transcript_97124/m.243516 type:complete len:117 (-) Transcript_97124:16-366(-)